jgi:hypothetical protein
VDCIFKCVFTVVISILFYCKCCTEKYTCNCNLYTYNHSTLIHSSFCVLNFMLLVCRPNMSMSSAPHERFRGTVLDRTLDQLNQPRSPSTISLITILILHSHWGLSFPTCLLFSLFFPVEHVACISKHSHACYMPRPSYRHWFNHSVTTLHYNCQVRLYMSCSHGWCTWHSEQVWAS